MQTPVIPWPRVNRAFGQSPPAQPLHDFQRGVDAEIRLVMHSRAELATPNATVLDSGKLATDYVLLNFWVSAKKPGAGQSELLAQQIAERLKALLTNPDTRYELAERGIAHLQPTGPPMPIPSADYAKRLVSCNAQLQYPVQFGSDLTGSIEMPAATVGATQTVNFFREAPLLTGVHLLGYYRWSVPVKVLSAQVFALAPQQQDVVLGLEVDGQFTGATLTILQEEPNVEVTAEAQFDNLVIPAEKPVRWQVISAPAAEFSAWQINLTIEVQPA